MCHRHARLPLCHVILCDSCTRADICVSLANVCLWYTSFQEVGIIGIYIKNLFTLLFIHTHTHRIDVTEAQFTQMAVLLVAAALGDSAWSFHVTTHTELSDGVFVYYSFYRFLCSGFRLERGWRLVRSSCFWLTRCNRLG